MSKKKCTNCGKIKAINTNFIKGTDKDQYSFICNQCRAKVDNLNKLEQFCTDDKRIFSLELWNRCMEEAKNEQSAIKLYFRQMNLGQYKSEFTPIPTIDDGDFDDIEQKIIIFWGRGKGFTKEDYQFLEENYDTWTAECKSDTVAEKKLFKEICLKELEIRKTRENGGSVDKQVEALQKLMESANVKPKDISTANDSNNQNVLGMIIKDIEQHRPAEYFQDKKMYEDYDGLKDYLERFIFRPLKNLLLGSKDFDKEFNIEKESVDDA